MGKSYLVEGARLKCLNGDKSSTLKVTDHGYYADGKKKANCKDCLADVNISDFGTCKKNKEGKVCKGFMKLSDSWIDTGNSSNLERVGGSAALTMDSVLLCNRGGLIVPETSGQGRVREINWKAFLARYGKKRMGPLLGKKKGCMYNYDPVNVNTGNFLYEKEDLVIPGMTKMSFHIFYNSLEEGKGTCLGMGWHHNYEIFIEQRAEGIEHLHLGDGRELLFQRSIGNVYLPVFGGVGLLRKDADGYCYVLGNQELIFGRDGLLRTATDKNGNANIFSYNEQGQLEQVVGANGGVLNYQYNKEGNIYRIYDHTGREVYLWYSYGLLRKFQNSMGYIYSYEYNENGRLESVTTPRGIEGVKNDYDGVNRVKKQEMPDGGEVEFLYDDEGMWTYTKSPDGQIISYESDEKFRNIKTVYRDSEEKFDFNEKDQLILYEDRNGNRTVYSYDEKGNLAEIKDALGNKTKYVYNNQNQMIKKISPRGGYILKSYDDRGNLTERTDSCGNTFRIVYNHRNQPMKITQPDGSQVKVEYDKRGNVTEVMDPSGSRTVYEYDSLNRVTAAADGNGNRTEYVYDAMNHIVKIKNALGMECSYEYSPSGKVVKITDFSGTIQRMQYDLCNRPEQFENEEGNISEYLWDNMGRLISEKLPNGAEIGYMYDENGRLTEYQDPMGGKMKFLYDANGNRIQTVNAVGNSRFYEYDALNRLSGETDEDGNRTEYEYDADGNLTGITDALGNKRCMEYDGLGRKVRETNALGNSISYQYDNLGKIVRIEDDAGKAVCYQYYPGGLLKQVEYPDGRKVGFSYDGNQNVKEKWNERGYRLNYYYNEQNQMVSICDNDNHRVTYAYDAVGNIVSFTDADGNTAKYKYSPIGRLASAEDAAGTMTRYFYDELGELTAVFRTGSEEEKGMALEEAIKLNEEQHKLRITLYERDLAGRIISVTDSLGNMERFNYDAEGRMIRKQDKEGNMTDFSYTLGGQVGKVVYADGRSAEYSYGPLGRLEEVRDWLGVTTMEYDRYGRLVKETGYDGKSIAYEWGSLNEQKALIYPDGSRVEYEYDELMRMKEMKSGIVRTQYRYDAMGKMDRKICGGVVSSYLYDKQGRISSLTHECYGELLESLRYGYSPTGDKKEIVKYRKGIAEESGIYHYRYDSIGRLTGAEKDGKTLREYEYDLFHNRIAMTENGNKIQYSYNALDQMVGMDEERHYEYLYDNRGNLEEVLADGETERRYRYDAAGKLELSENEDGDICSYTYNGMGERVVTERRTGGKKVRTEYHTDEMKNHHNLIMQESEEGCQKYFWGIKLEGLEEEGKESNVLLDEMGSPQRILWGNGKQRFRYGYDEFGRDLYGNAGEGQPFGYTGYIADRVSGTYYAQAREYLPKYGRFAGQDILKGNAGVPITLNGYVYCRNSALNYVDVLGTEEKKGDGDSQEVEGPVCNEPWWYIFLYGTDADVTLKEYLKTKYPEEFEESKYGTSVFIPNGLKFPNPYYNTDSGHGFADIVFYDEEDNIIEVYELKPDTAYGYSSGPLQLSGYIWAIKYNIETPKWQNYNFWQKKVKKEKTEEIKVTKGNSYNDNFNVTLISLGFEYKDEENLKIIYRTDPAYEGVIFWSSADRKDPGKDTTLKRRAKQIAENKDKKKIYQIEKEDKTAAMKEALMLSIAIAFLFGDDTVGGVADDVLIPSLAVELWDTIKVLFTCGSVL